MFGSERILSKEHLALTQASQIVESYGFKDSLADQKALVEALAGLLGRMGGALLDRVAAGSLRFRLLKGKPSHEKLYLLSAPDRRRVITGSANLSLAAFAGRQAEILTVFDGTRSLGAFRRILPPGLQGQCAGRCGLAGFAAAGRRLGSTHCSARIGRSACRARPRRARGGGRSAAGSDARWLRNRHAAQDGSSGRGVTRPAPAAGQERLYDG